MTASSPCSWLVWMARTTSISLKERAFKNNRKGSKPVEHVVPLSRVFLRFWRLVLLSNCLYCSSCWCCWQCCVFEKEKERRGKHTNARTRTATHHNCRQEPVGTHKHLFGWAGSGGQGTARPPRVSLRSFKFHFYQINCGNWHSFQMSPPISMANYKARSVILIKLEFFESESWIQSHIS